VTFRQTNSSASGSCPCLFPTQCGRAPITILHPTAFSMPTSARKSSIGGARRGLQKAHIPYRGDNPEVGKKTGIAVQYADVGSDGFEPFEDVIQHADGRTPPRPKLRKKSLAQSGRHDDDYDEEDGEQSMQIDSEYN